MRKYAIKARKIGTLTVLATCASALHAQGTWIWQPQCGNLRWAEICSDSDDSCGARYFNNWGLSRCGSPPSLPGPGSICIFPSGSNALLDNTVDILSIDIDSNASLRWGRGAPSIWLTLRNPSDNSLGTLTNAGLFRIAGTCGPSFRFSGMLVNNNLLIHESGCVEFNRSILQNNNTAEVRDGGWFGNTMADSFINTGRLNKTTAGEFRIALQTQQQNAIVDVRAGRLVWHGTSDVPVTEYNHHNVNWSVASGASLILGLSNRDTHTFSGTHNWSVAENGSAALGEGTHIFTGTHSGEIAGTLSQGYGTVRVGSEGATFNFTGTGYLWQNGILDGGSTGLTNAGVLRISAGIYGRVLEGVLVNTGTLVHATGTVGFSYATLRNSGAIQLSRGGWFNSSGAFVNTGTLTKETLNDFRIEVPMQQQNAQVAVLEGLLSIGGSSSHTHQDVVWSVASGATLQFPSGTHTIRGVNRGEIAGTLIQTGGTVRAATDGGTLNFTGTGFQCSGGALSGGSAGLANAGVLRIVGGASLAGLLLNSGVLVQEAGNTDFAGVLVNTGTLVHATGTVGFSYATLRNSGAIQLSRGQWSNSSGTNAFVNTGTLTKETLNNFWIEVPMQQQNAQVAVLEGLLSIGGSSSHTHQDVVWSVASGATLQFPSGTHTIRGVNRGEIAGTLIQTGGTVRAATDGGTLNFTGTGFQCSGGALSGGSAGLANAGVLRIVGGASLAGLLLNSGVLVQEAGNTDFNGASLRNSGTVELRDGQWRNISGTNTIVNTGTLTKETLNDFRIWVPMQQQNAQVAVLEGLLSIGGSSSHTHQNVSWSVASGATLVLGGTHTFSGTHSGAIAGTLIQTGGTVRAATDGGTLNFTGTGFQCSGGALSGGSAGLANAGVLRIVGGASLAGLLLNSGVLVQEAGNTDFNGASLRNSGTVELRDGQWRNISGTNTIVNTGTLRKTTTTNFAIAINTTNSGLIEVQNGTLSVNNLTQTAGETRIHRGANLSVSNPLAMQGGKLTGAGQLNGALNNTAGTIAPGIDDPDQPDLNPLGILTINGNLTLGNNAVFEVELTGTDNSDPANPQYDRVLISGSNRTVQVNGTLRVKGRDGYAPATGDTFDILVRSGSSWNATGGFRRVEVDPDTLPCVQVEVRYLSDRAQLVVTRAQGSPDINRDGCVDDADLLAVLFAFGQTGSNLAEDINCDGVVDDADLLSVLFAFGSGC